MEEKQFTPTPSATQPRKRFMNLVIGVVAVVLVGIGGAVGLQLVQQQQDIRQQAAVVVPSPDTTVTCHRTNSATGLCEQQAFTNSCGSGWTIGSCPTSCGAWSTCLKNGSEPCYQPGTSTQGVRKRTCGANIEEEYCQLPACAVPSPTTTFTCYKTANNCAPSSQTTQCPNNNGIFSSQGNCLNQLCPGGTGSLSGSTVSCRCNDKNTGNPVTYPPGPLPAACTGTGTTCPTGQVLVNGNCYPSCTATAGNCATSLLTNSYLCGTPNNTTQYCCPSGRYRDGNQCLLSPTCDNINADCRYAGTGIVNGVACVWPGITPPSYAVCCPTGSYNVNGVCRPSADLPSCSSQGIGTSCRATAVNYSISCKNNAGEIQRCCPTGQVINNTTGSCVNASSVPNPGQCLAAGTSCSTASSTNGGCCVGSYCTGVSGQQKCNVPPATDNAELRCILGDGVCGGTGGFISFSCSGLTNGVCLSNPKTHNSFAEARQRVVDEGSCGQVDTTCVGGTEDRKLCGSFEIITSGCGGTPGSPQPSPSPTPTPPAPMCLNIAMSPSQPTIGSSVTFTCGQVPGVHHYEFRVKLPDGTIQNLAAASTNDRSSVPLTITTAGNYKAQCRICTGTSSTTCQSFEAL